MTTRILNSWDDLRPIGTVFQVHYAPSPYTTAPVFRVVSWRVIDHVLVYALDEHGPSIWREQIEYVDEIETPATIAVQNGEIVYLPA